MAEASELRSIKIHGKIEYFLGGDLKFLTIVCGIEAANAKYACVWYKCSNSDRWGMSKDWSAFDVSKGARTIDEIEKCSKLLKAICFQIHSNRSCDHRHSPPLSWLTHQSSNPWITSTGWYIKGYSWQGKAQPRYIIRNFLEHCKIHFRWYTSQETKQMQWRDLTGPEKTRLFQNIDIPKLFPSLPNAAILQDIWTDSMS